MADHGITKTPAPSDGQSGGVLDLIERIGNRLPDPSTLFFLGMLIVMALSAIAAWGDWQVQPKLPQPVTEQVVNEAGETVERPVLDADGQPVLEWRESGEPLKARSLLTRDGLFWAISSMVDNFMAFPPLGVVLVGMLGIGIAERTGLIAALLKGFMLIVPGVFLTPSMVFIGIMSSMALDAGYVVLPPLAALLYKAMGRSPLVGIAAVFAGVSAGFNANLFITGLEPMLAGFANVGGQVIDPEYQMNPACNWYFMIASTFVMTLTGWAVTSFFVERRLHRKSPEDGGPVPAEHIDMSEHQLTSTDFRGLRAALGAFVVGFGALMTMIVIPGAPLYTYKLPVLIQGSDETILPDHEAVTEWEGRIEQWSEAEGEDEPQVRWVKAERWEAPDDDADAARPAENYERSDGTVLIKVDGFSRWVDSIVPMLFIVFIIPGIAFGIAVGNIRNDKDVAKLLIESMAAMAPIIVLAFFAAQFIEYFEHSGLDRMLAMAGGQALGQADMPIWLLIVVFILITVCFNLFIGSMSAKYAMFAPIFIPMFMLVGISPELTQAAYRIGDSVSNIITPLNAYLIIILVFMQKYVPKGGMGTLISTMLPYTIVFTIVWTALLLLWMGLGIPLGVDGPLTYDVTQIAG